MRILIALSALYLCCAVRAGALNATVTKADGTPIADTVVIAEPVDAPVPPPPRVPETEIVDQIDKQFVPYVKVIRAGSFVSFPNKDNIRHQVYSFSRAKRFELPLYAGTPAAPVKFDTPGIVTLGCNIHDWMIGYIYVTDTPWYAKTGDDGKATIRDLPAGNYDVRIWHPRMGESESDTKRTITINAAGTLPETWTISLKPDIRPRRAPLGRVGSYR